MKRATVLALALAISATVAGCTSTPPDTRTDAGIISGIIYHDDGDYTSVEITTAGGDVWTVDDYTAPLGTHCQVTFQTMGTDDRADDKITEIQTVTKF